MKKYSLLTILLLSSILSLRAQTFIDVTPRNNLSKFIEIYHRETGDMNGDGLEDIITSGRIEDDNGSQRSILALHLSDGKGNFSLQTDNILAQSVTSFTLADIDLDGDLDISYLTQPDSSSTLSELFNNGKGDFTQKTKTLDLPVMDLISISYSDLNKNKQNELFISGRTFRTDSVDNPPPYTIRRQIGNSFLFEKKGEQYSKINNSNIEGHWGPKPIFKDLNNDGLVDIFIASLNHVPQVGATSSRILIYHNKGNFKFEEKELVKLFYNAEDLKAEDLNNDGKIDLIASAKDTYMGHFGESTLILSNKGNLIFEEMVNPDLTSEGGEIELIDFNKDGFKDILTSGRRRLGSGFAYRTENSCKLFLNDSGKGFKLDSSNFIYNSGGSLNSLDVNNDGNSDIIIDDIIYLTNDSGKLNYTSPHFYGQLKDVKSSVLDFNKDSFPDLIINGINQNGESETKVFLNQSNGKEFIEEPNHPFPAMKDMILQSDKGSSIMVFIGRNSSGNMELKIFEENNEVLKEEISLQEVSQILLLDINNDKKTDILINGKDSTSASLTVYFNEGGDTYHLSNNVVNYGQTIIKVEQANIDGDNFPDLFFSNGQRVENQILWDAIYLTNIKGEGYALDQADTLRNILSGSATAALFLSDLDGDGDDDLIANGQFTSGTYTAGPKYFSFYENVDGHFKEFEKFKKGYGGQSVGFVVASAIEDLNNDGTEEMVFLHNIVSGSRYYPGKYTNSYQNKIMVNIDHLTLRETRCSSLPNMSKAEIKPADFNQDGFEDLFIIGKDQNGVPKVYIYQNQGTRLPYSTEQIMACDSVTWINGKTYTGSNYIDVYPRVYESLDYSPTFDCETRTALHLTLGQSNFWTDTVEATGEFTWIDGKTYLESTQTATYTLTNQSGCDSVVTLNLTLIPLSAEKDPEINIYPNPTGQVLNLKLGHQPETEVEFQIISSNGILRRKWTSKEQSQTMNIGDLEAGAYFIEFSDGEKKRGFRFVRR
ncbi:FG-GAP-like repeat-containing protein [Jiulongibacter sediminis]|uniref:Secretion system C-terminal sorting domain-containing protein n=1 Tax=Jiulongibacter sediminis TaxID=1605367 RepID=A0A0N8H9D4_9BACT|nr:FG-GAP-like repeat-containing protein [Jiulongibacter sediminis]KPM47060.1 hypothetical protein AFM12_17720 [Jiulongibacter sediminis]TBX22404.1 hypothetical protein TK44_17725 [Jiulongibacter sediminis]